MDRLSEGEDGPAGGCPGCGKARFQRGTNFCPGGGSCPVASNTFLIGLGLRVRSRLRADLGIGSGSGRGACSLEKGGTGLIDREPFGRFEFGEKPEDVATDETECDGRW